SYCNTQPIHFVCLCGNTLPSFPQPTVRIKGMKTKVTETATQVNGHAPEYTIREIIYTINLIENLNGKIRKNTNSQYFSVTYL
ncbi:hypothetical protein, partial [uncultured Duncaniella sp.]